jgi:hypothetical protein
VKFILFFTLLIFSQYVAAFHYAIVKSKRAVIYADILKTSPIGYVKMGKKVRVGEVARNRGLMLPIIVSAKVAYISVADVSVLDGSEVILPKNHDSIIGLEIRKRKFVSGHTYFLSDFTQGKYSIGQTEEKTVALSGFFIKKEKNKNATNFKRYGLEYMTFTGEDERLSIPSVVFEWVKRYYESGRFKVRGVFGVGVSPYVIYAVEPYFALNGFSAHVEIGAEGVVYLFEDVSIQLKASYRAQKLMEFDLPEPLNTFDPLMLGFSVAASLAYSY